MQPLKTENYKGLTINIFQDESAESPNEWGNEDSFIVYDHRQFNVERKGFAPDEIYQHTRDTKRFFYEGYFVFPLYAYIHSGVALSLGNETYPFSCGWDTSMTGFVLIKRSKGYYTRAKCRKLAESLVVVWNQYLSGDVYGYEVEQDGESIDSCWGFYGQKDCLEEARDIADYHVTQTTKKHGHYLKALIKNHVPLIYRKPLRTS